MPPGDPLNLAPWYARLWNWLKRYRPLLGLLIFLIIVSFFLIPPKQWNGEFLKAKPWLVETRFQAIVASFIFGALVGMTEIASRYRDEPLVAIRSPFGTIYCALNGYISVLAFFLIFRFPEFFGAVAESNLLAALTAGFGSSVVMRARVAIIKDDEGKENSIGVDYVIRIILQLVDGSIDRWRAVDRQRLIKGKFKKIRSLGDFATATTYLVASLQAFQNLDESRKQKLTDKIAGFAGASLPPDIKLFNVAFAFLDEVGETNFNEMLDNTLSRIPSPESPIAAITNLPAPTPPPDLQPNPPTTGLGPNDSKDDKTESSIDETDAAKPGPTTEEVAEVDNGTNDEGRNANVSTSAPVNSEDMSDGKKPSEKDKQEES
jgi:hypothetical protein